MRVSGLRPLLVASLLVAGLAPSPLRAQEPEEGACPELGELLAGASQALAEVRLDDAWELGQDAQRALSCQQRVVNPLTLVSLYQLLGAVAYYRGDPSQAELLFGQAVLVLPGTPVDPNFGEDVAAIYDDVRSRLLAAPTGSIEVDAGVEAWVDGHRVEPGYPLDLLPGLHLLQYRGEGGLVDQPFRVAPGESLRLQADGHLGRRVGTASVEPEAAGEPLPATPVAPAPRAPAGRGEWGWFAAGGGAALAGGVALALAVSSRHAFDTTTDPGELEPLQHRTNALAGTGIGLELAAGGCLGVGIVHLLR